MQATRDQSVQLRRSEHEQGQKSYLARRILIVDDDQAMLKLLEFSIEKLGSDYQIVTALNGVEAMNKLEQQQFDLVVTDYMMPNLTGVDLALAIRRISPATQIVLMTAYGTKRLRETTDCLDFDGYLNKPFSIEDIRVIVKQTASRIHHRQETSRIDVTVTRHMVEPHLRVLLTNANARGVLLMNRDGRPLLTVGQLDRLEVSKMSAFVAANFLATVELANILGSRSVFKSSYHEGDDHNIYAHDVDGQYLLAVVFDTKHKPGVVWYYAKQTATKLVRLLNQAD